MEYHSVYMIFELLFLKYQIAEDSSVKINDLRNAFYELEFNVNDINGTKQRLDFDSELERILEDFSCIFEICDDEISFKDEDPNALYEAIPEFLEEEPTAIDRCMTDFIASDNIYFALKLEPPLHETQSIFETNKTIIFLYELIAKLESVGKDSTPARKIISFHKSCLKEYFGSIDDTTYLKIKICLAHYNYKFLTNEAKPNINSNWYLALLSNNKHRKHVISYDKIFYYIDKYRQNGNEEETDEIESKDLVTTSFNREIGDEQTPDEYLAETCYIADEVEYFLANYILYLNSYINQVDNSEVKIGLLQKKYLLLSLNDLDDTEDYYLSEGTLDTLPLPPYIKEWFNPDSFDFLIGNFEEILANIRITDSNMTPLIESNIIINLLLLKCFLDLSINDIVKNELIAEISNPEFYHNSSFSILTNYIDSIIFSKREINRQRNKGN